MSHVEKRTQVGRVTYRARWRDPSGRERKRSFNRKTDAQRFLVGVEDAKLRGAYVDPAKGKVGFADWAERWSRMAPTLWLAGPNRPRHQAPRRPERPPDSWARRTKGSIPFRATE